MKKLNLKLDDLQIESFDTGPTGAGRGTVEGYHHYTKPGYGSCANTECGSCYSCQGQYTCDVSCASCEVSCVESDCTCYFDICNPTYYC